MQHAKRVVQESFKVPPGIQLVVFAKQDDTQQVRDQLHALIVHPERMPILLVPLIAKIVTTMHTSPTPMLRNAFQCKKGSINRVQQPKLNARRVKQDVVVTKRVKIVALDGFKNHQATLRAVNVQLVLATKFKVLRHAMLSLVDLTAGTA